MLRGDRSPRGRLGHTGLEGHGGPATDRAADRSSRAMNAVMIDSGSAALEPAPARQTRMAIPWPWVAGLSTAAAGALHLVASFDLRSGGKLVVSGVLLAAFLQISVVGLFGGTYWRPVDTGSPVDRVPAPLWVLAAIV